MAPDEKPVLPYEMWQEIMPHIPRFDHPAWLALRRTCRRLRDCVDSMWILPPHVLGALAASGMGGLLYAMRRAPTAAQWRYVDYSRCSTNTIFYIVGAIGPMSVWSYARLMCGAPARAAKMLRWMDIPGIQAPQDAMAGYPAGGMGASCALARELLAIGSPLAILYLKRMYRRDIQYFAYYVGHESPLKVARGVVNLLVAISAHCGYDVLFCNARYTFLYDPALDGEYADRVYRRMLNEGIYDPQFMSLQEEYQFAICEDILDPRAKSYCDMWGA